MLFIAAPLLLLPSIVAGGNVTFATQGQWTTHLTFPAVPVAGALLSGLNGGDHKVFVWSSWGAYKFGGARGWTESATWDLKTGNISGANLSQTGHDMFRPGINLDFNGQLTVAGGDNANITSQYDSVNNVWTRQAYMNVPRGYQSTTTLSDGRSFTIGGSWSGALGGKTGEVYDPASNTWTILQGCNVSALLTKDTKGVYRANNHPWLFPWSNGFVLQAGPSNAMHWYDTNGQGNTSFAGYRNGPNGIDQMCGPAVMYDAGSIFSYGGAQSYDVNPANNTANIITLSTPSQNPIVSWTGAGTYSRIFGNSIVLPDGTIMVTGEQYYAKLFSDDNAVRTPEIFDPVAKTFMQVAGDPSNRTYHSMALLLPDAAVLTAGGGMCNPATDYCKLAPIDDLDGNVFRPPYLYDQNGNDAVRPKINKVNGQSVPGSAVQVSLGKSMSITIGRNAPNPSFSIIRVGSNTHTVNTDHRRISLQATAGGGFGSTFITTIPSDPGVALPGIRYLFVVVGGVPSNATIIQVTPN